MEQKVIATYTAPVAGQEMILHEEVELEKGKGIRGDRYYNGSGTFSRNANENADHEVTLIASEEIDRFNALHGRSLDYGSFRRNIVTAGINLNDLVGQEFRVGEVTLIGVRLCEPCAWLARILVPEVLPDLVGRGGLRTRILREGRIRAGDAIHVEETTGS